MTTVEARRDAVLRLLQDKAPGWVEGPEIATEEVGGSEGLRRLRELREAGHLIDKQRIPGRDAFRYRYVGPPGSLNPMNVQPTREVESGMRPQALPGRPDRYVNVDRARAQAIDAERKARQEADDARRLATPYREGPLRIAFGQSLCRWCQGTGGNRLHGPCSPCGGKGLT